MKELLFKLKKGGKCIGYMRTRALGPAKRLRVQYRNCPDLCMADDLWEEECRIDFDSIHPCVCRDRRGKDVFEGDTIRGLCTRQKHQKYNRFTGIVKWSEQYHWFEVAGKDTDGDLICPNFGEIVLADIELVEEAREEGR